MTNTNQNREQTNHRITYAATTEGIKRAEKALRRIGIASKTSFAELCDLSRSTITKFFGGQSIELDCFETICNELQLSNWKEIAGINSFDTNGQAEQEPNPCHPRIDDDNEEIPFSFAGSVKEKDIPKLKNILKLIRTLANDDYIEAIDVKKSCIKLTLKGSQAGLERLEQLFQSGELTKIFKQKLNIIVEDVSFIDAQTSDNYQQSQTNKKKQLVFTIAGDVNQADINILKDALIDTSENEEKSRLIEEIKTQGAVKRNLSGVDLSGANLSGADLSDADLSGANLSDAVLYGANLSGANISDANLSDANLIRTYLRGANLIRTYLRGANLSEAVLYGAYLRGANLIRTDLIRTDLSDADLSDADLSGANISDANLSDANLSDADLSDANLGGTNLSDANVKNARFADNLGISESLKQDLKARGAIFEDSPGDRSPSLTPA
jgi:uncharacterized protein YjbI with pentapeptide repeats